MAGSSVRSSTTVRRSCSRQAQRIVRLTSNTFSAAPFGSSDPRSLGVMLSGLAFSGTHRGEPHRIALDDERLSAGVYQVENHAGALPRWTDGSRPRSATVGRPLRPCRPPHDLRQHDGPRMDFTPGAAR